jgi:FAD:protein FMN transferase
MAVTAAARVSMRLGPCKGTPVFLMFLHFAYRLVPAAVLAAVAMTPCASAQETDPSSAPMRVITPVPSKDALPYRFTHRAMGTEFVFTIYGDSDDAQSEDVALVAREAFQAVDALEQEISSWISSSGTSAVNREASRGPVYVRPEVWRLLQFASRTWRETDGAFDITVGPLIDYWRDAGSRKIDRGDPKFSAALARVGMDKVDLDSDSKGIAFGVPGMRISFGGIGKGLALDRAAEVLAVYGVKSALLSGGDSSILAIGSPPGREFWKIGIHNPYNGDSDLETVLLRDQALSTSACFHQVPGALDGVPCGIFNPKTGLTVGGMLSVTVVASTGMATDALSTAFYVMGETRVREYCAAHRDVGAILVSLPEDKQPRPVRLGTIETKP